MKQPLIILGVLLALSACKLETRSSAELLFPLGQHTWNKGEDYRNSPPSDQCTGCPEFELNSPGLNSLQESGWRIELPSGDTSTAISGIIRGFADHPECGRNNDILCDSAWRVWPPDSNDSIVHQQSPGDDIFDHDFVLHPSFECGVSRFVLAAQNTYGTTRLILEVERKGGVCDAPIDGPTVRVILKWNERNTDLDLHLIKEGGSFGDSSTDCYFENCQPGNNSYGTSGLDWGQVGQASDNPFLDVDDDQNAGPENIFLYGAEDGAYTIDVHYHPNSQSTVRVLPDVEVWSDGVLVDWIFYDINAAEFTPDMIWTPATIQIKKGVVTLQALHGVRNF